MSFADPQSVTVNAVAQSLPRTGSGNNSGTFRSSDGSYVLEVSHQNSGKARTRRMIKLTSSKITTDPLTSGSNIAVSATVYLVADVPTAGYTVAEQKYLVDALVDYLDAASGAKVTQFLGGEN